MVLASLLEVLYLFRVLGLLDTLPLGLSRDSGCFLTNPVIPLSQFRREIGVFGLHFAEPFALSRGRGFRGFFTLIRLVFVVTHRSRVLQVLELKEIDVVPEVFGFFHHHIRDGCLFELALDFWLVCHRYPLIFCGHKERGQHLSQDASPRCSPGYSVGTILHYGSSLSFTAGPNSP